MGMGGDRTRAQAPGMHTLEATMCCHTAPRRGSGTPWRTQWGTAAARYSVKPRQLGAAARPIPPVVPPLEEQMASPSEENTRRVRARVGPTDHHTPHPPLSESTNPGCTRRCGRLIGCQTEKGRAGDSFHARSCAVEPHRRASVRSHRGPRVGGEVLEELPSNGPAEGVPGHHDPHPPPLRRREPLRQVPHQLPVPGVEPPGGRRRRGAAALRPAPPLLLHLDISDHPHLGPVAHGRRTLCNGMRAHPLVQRKPESDPDRSHPDPHRRTLPGRLFC